MLDTASEGGWVKRYRTAQRECIGCPLKATCLPKGTYKQLVRTIFGEPYRRAWQRQQSRRGQRMRRVRQSTVEPVFGSLIHHYGLRRMNVRGQAGARKTVLLTALAYNLKKLLKHRPTQQVSLQESSSATATTVFRTTSLPTPTALKT
jgi:hypothetical protein